MQTRVRKTQYSVQITYRFSQLSSDPDCIFDFFSLKRPAGNDISWVSGCAQISNETKDCSVSNDPISFAISSSCQGAASLEVTIAWQYSAEIQLVRSDLNFGSASGECSTCTTIVPETYQQGIPAGSIQLTPLCITGVREPYSFWELSNMNPQAVNAFISKRGANLYTPYTVPAGSSIYFQTSGDTPNDIYEVTILNGNNRILVDSSLPAANSCPVNASGCCDQLTIRNPNPFRISILYQVYDLEGTLEAQNAVILYPCSDGSSQGCSYVIPEVSVASSLVIQEQTLSGQLASLRYSREQLQTGCSDTCIPISTTSGRTTGTTGTGTSGTTGTTGVTSLDITGLPTTGTTGTCDHYLQCVHPQSVWDWNLCKCIHCPIDNDTCALKNQEFDEIVCSCNGTSPTSGGGGTQTNTAAITGGAVSAGTVAGAAAAALYFLARRKKQPEEEVIDADLAFAHVIESNPLYQDPMPTYDNPIYEGGGPDDTPSF